MTTTLLKSKLVLKLAFAAAFAVSAQGATIFSVTGSSFGIGEDTTGSGSLTNEVFSTEGLPIFSNVIGLKGFGSTTLTVTEDGFFELFALMEGIGQETFSPHRNCRPNGSSPSARPTTTQ